MTTPAHFLQTLHALPALPGVFNPWRDHDALHDVDVTAPEIRSAHLEQYLGMRAGKAKLVLVAEAPGYQGCKFSGLAMTSERILLGSHKAVPADVVFKGQKARTSHPSLKAAGYTEPTATVVWPCLLSLGFAPEDFVLWNAFPCHPFDVDDPNPPMSNRAPTNQELAATRHVLPAMLSLMPDAKVIAIGKVAQKTLESLGMTVPQVRHPSMGGANDFRQQMAAHLQRLPKS